MSSMIPSMRQQPIYNSSAAQPPASQFSCANAPTVAEFFAGIGLVRIGLEAAGFKVVWSNDYEPKKKTMYRGHFQDKEHRHTFVLGDVRSITGFDMPSNLSLAWASFPCTDLSLAGNGKGIRNGESKTFWEFIRILSEMGESAPEVVCLENVAGLATTNGGNDLRSAIRALNELGFSVDVLSLDARRFVPQSRERLFLIGAKTPPGGQDWPVSDLRPDNVQFVFNDPSLVMHAAVLPDPPTFLKTGLAEMVEEMPEDDPRWWESTCRDAALASLSDTQMRRIKLLKQHKEPVYRTGYRRTRNGKPVWEFREDDISGCLRTARGGSSRQAVLRACGNEVGIRWMTPLEYARLMGAGDYTLGTVSTAQTLYGFGDAVCVPAVEWLARHYLLPLMSGMLQHYNKNALSL